VRIHAIQTGTVAVKSRQPQEGAAQSRHVFFTPCSIGNGPSRCPSWRGSSNTLKGSSWSIPARPVGSPDPGTADGTRTSDSVSRNGSHLRRRSVPTSAVGVMDRAPDGAPRHRRWLSERFMGRRRSRRRSTHRRPAVEQALGAGYAGALSTGGRA
jgi:hypothetical protein